MDFGKIKRLDANDKIQIELIRLTDGGGLLRLVDLPTGLTPEKMLDPQQSVFRQKKRLMDFFAAALAHADLTAA